MKPTLEQLLRVPHVDSEGEFGRSPDGSHLAFCWNKTGSWEIYELDLRGDAEPRQLTAPAGGKFRPRYSPDGGRLAYALDPDGGESFHIRMLDLASGQDTDLTPDITFAHQPNIDWSPDGRELAILSDAGGQFALYLLPLEGGTPQLLFDSGHPCWDAHWSPDGKRIAVEVEWHQQDRSIFLVNRQDGGRRQLQEKGKVLNAMHPAWSPDGRALAFCADPGGWYGIGLYDMGTQQVRWLNGDEAEYTEPRWSPDGQRVVCVRTKGADTALFVYDLLHGFGTRYCLGPGIHSHPQFSRDGQSIYFVFESPLQPDDLWQLDPVSGAFAQLTHSLPDDIGTSSLVMSEEVWYPSTDGVMIPAILYRGGTPNGPALVNIHGGPNWLFQRNWYPIMSYLASQGWTVLAPNYRGSTCYGRAWAYANSMRLGEIDTADCAAAVDYLIREKLADPKRILVSGRSHGGYLTMGCLTEYPDLWAGGSAVVPFLNWFTSHENSREDLQHWNIENFGDPVENAELWRRRSPFFYLEQVQAAVQLICSGNDPRCPASDSIKARDRLQELGKQVELLLYADEGHALLKTENIVDEETRRVEFLERMAGVHHNR